MPPAIQSLYNQGIVSDLDVYFAKFITTFAGCADDNLLLGVLLVSYFAHQGHSCIDLSTQAEKPFPPLAAPGITTVRCPTLATWLTSLQKCSAVGRPSNYTPLILDKYRLYLYRYWDYEQQLAANLRTRLYKSAPKINHAILQDGLARLFPTPVVHEELKQAARVAIHHHFCLISGGPGTGKTTMILKILALLLEQNPHLNIALVTPTGKTAAHLQEVLRETQPLLNCAPAVKAALPQEVYTVHSLLASLSDPASSSLQAFNRRQLSYDVVVIDDATLLDLAQLTKLAEAIPVDAQWMLLGDKDQVAATATSTVLNDIWQAGNSDADNMTSRRLSESRVLLPDHSRHDHTPPGLRKLAELVKQGRGEQALQLLKTDQYPEVSWHHLRIFEALPTSLTDHLVAKFATYFTADRPEQLLPQLTQFGLLCVLRQGPYGTESINRQIEQKLSQRNLLPPATGYHHHYPGQPLMITRHDYTLKLFQGDLGMMLRDPAHPQELQAFFTSPDGRLRTCWPPRLPEHETVYAMTVPHSQGTQFDEVFLLLPDQPSPYLTRQLIYTAITRARQRLTVWGTDAIWKAAISQISSRTSGLQEALLNEIVTQFE